MKKKQTFNVLLDPTTKDIVAPNRKTYRGLKSDTYEPTRVQHTQLARADKEFKSFRSSLAVSWGSQTGKLKKKHINRERQFQLENAE